MLTVTVCREDGAEQVHTFDKPAVMIGRAAGNDLCLEVGGVSRYHARLSVEDGILTIEDLGSTNGTFVGSDKVSRRELKSNDHVVIGNATLSAAFADEAQSPAPSPEPELPTGVSPAQAEMPQTEKPRALGEGSSAMYWQSLAGFLGPVWQHIENDAVSEIMINGHQEIYIEQRGKLERIDVRFSPEQLKAAVMNIAQFVGRRVSEEEPYLDARLPDGSRVAVLLPPCSRKGISVSIRKFTKEKLTLEKLVSFGSLSPEMVTFLEAAVLLKKNIIVSGGTSSGKTSLLNVVSGLIPADERILTIEDSAELQLSQEHVVPMETKPPDKKGRGQVTIRDLVRASLRMRPDRIIVGEIRAGEALDLLQAMNTGHSGSMATVHASSPRQALTRLETLALFSGLDIPIRALREQVSSAIDIVVQAARLPDATRKVTHISEVGQLTDDGAYQVFDIFRYQRKGMVSGRIEGSHVWTGHRPNMIEEMELANLEEALRLFGQESR